MTLAELLARTVNPKYWDPAWDASCGDRPKWCAAGERRTAIAIAQAHLDALEQLGRGVKPSADTLAWARDQVEQITATGG